MGVTQVVTGCRVTTMDQIEHIMKELFRLHFAWTNINEQQVKIYLILCFYVLIIMCFYVRIFNISHICDVIKCTNDCGQRLPLRCTLWVIIPETNSLILLCKAFSETSYAAGLDHIWLPWSSYDVVVALKMYMVVTSSILHVIFQEMNTYHFCLHIRPHTREHPWQCSKRDKSLIETRHNPWTVEIVSKEWSFVQDTSVQNDITKSGDCPLRLNSNNTISRVSNLL